MLASGRPLGFGAGWPGGFTQGSKRGLQLGFGCQVISRLLSLRDSFTEFIRSFFCSIYLPLEVVYLLAMGSRATNNSLQTAPLMSTPSSGDDNVANVPSMSRSGGSLEGLPAADVGGEAGISPAMVSLIAQTVRAALAAERANDSPSSLASTPPIPSVSSPSVPSTTMTASSGGVPPLLSSSTHAFLTAGAGVAGPSLPGRPIQSMYPVVPSFVSTFANPSMSVFSSTSVYDLPTDATRVVAESPEPPGSSSSSILCKSWNKGRCTAPFSFCRYAHRCSACSGAHRASSCSNQSSNDGVDRTKRRSRSPSALGSHAKARRS